MNKFVFLSFILMGWIFFELSDGTDFKPRVDPALMLTASTPVTIPDPAEPVTIVTTALALPTSTCDSETDVAVVEIPLTPTRDSSETELSEGTILTELPDITLVSLENGGVGLGGLLAGFDPNVIGLSKTVVPESEPQATAEPELPVADLRTISANHVNMRNGPGTTYDVVTRLRLGEEVEILGDSGSGWLRLRLVSNRTVGWISASLVSKPDR